MTTYTCLNCGVVQEVQMSKPELEGKSLELLWCDKCYVAPPITQEAREWALAEMERINKRNE